MKKGNILSHVAMLILAIGLVSCDKDVTIVSEVHPNGSIDRTITLYNADSVARSKNMFGATEEIGWTIETEMLSENRSDSTSKAMAIVFRKHFESFERANEEMDTGADSLFGIHAKFQKRFRWFYTYIDYSETYRSLDRFHGVSQEAYFTKEDYTFINRLPAEGRPISKADSLYLAKLNEKIYDIYGARTVYNELFDDLLEIMENGGLERRWADSLEAEREKLFDKLVENGNDGDDEILALADSFRVPLTTTQREAYLKRSESMDRRMEFVGDASSTRFLQMIRMPWTVIASNADSVNHDELYWSPPAVKFLLSDYTMSATSRRLNIIPVVISGIVILLTIGLFVVRGGRKGIPAKGRGTP